MQTDLKRYLPNKEEKRRRLTEVSASVTGLLSLGITDLRGQMTLCCGSCPVHPRMLSSTSGLYPVTPVTSLSFHPTCECQKCLWTLPNVPWGCNHLWLRTTGLKVSDTQWALTHQESVGRRQGERVREGTALTCCPCCFSPSLTYNGQVDETLSIGRA